MWEISQGNPTTEIAHFERMGLDGLSLNSLIFTREQSIRGREGNNLLMHAHHHTLAYSLFFLPDSSVIYFLIFHYFPYLFFSRACLPTFPCLLCTTKTLFILPPVLGFFYCFIP